MSDHTAHVMLECIRREHRVTITNWVEAHPANGEIHHFVRAVANDGESWDSSAPDFYQAVCALAELMGWDLEG